MLDHLGRPVYLRRSLLGLGLRHEEGRLPGDSQSSAAGRVTTGRALFQAAGLPAPIIWTTPHYAAFIHPDDDPLSVLQQVVTGLKALGYTFVSPATLVSANG